MPLGDRLARYCIADLVIDVGRRSVRRGETEIHLSKLSFDVLQTLIEAAPNVVSNDELLHTVWKGVVVGPESVTQRVKLLRDALGDDHTSPRYIAGLRGQGYRLLPEVAMDSAPRDPAPREARESDTKGTRFGTRAVVMAAAGLAIALAFIAVTTIHTAKQRPLAQTAPPSAAESSPARTSPTTLAVPTANAFVPPPHSIAVLPFLNMSGDSNQEYLADGFTEELLNSLARIDGLQVSARTSSFYFKGEHADLATIARKLNVASVLEGSVRRSGVTIRVTAQLNNAVTGFHLWSQTYDRDLKDVLKLQTDIATAVANALKVTLLGDVAARLEVGGTRNPAAFDAYLRATMGYQGANTAREGQSVIAAYTDAIRLDPGYGLAYAGRSIALSSFAGAWGDRDYSAKAKADALKAIALAPELGEGHLALAVHLTDSLDFMGATQEFQRSLALAPGNTRVLRDYGEFEVLIGHTEAGLSAVRRSVVLDPLNADNHYRLGSSLLMARRNAEAIAAYTNAKALNPRDTWNIGWLGVAYYQSGEYDRARTVCESAGELPALVCLAMTYEKLGRHADAETMLAKAKASRGAEGAVLYAWIYAQRGENARALAWLETALRRKDPWLQWLKIPLLDSLRNEPRFQAIERELKFPE